jgi:hypothetical protein
MILTTQSVEQGQRNRERFGAYHSSYPKVVVPSKITCVPEVRPVRSRVTPDGARENYGCAGCLGFASCRSTRRPREGTRSSFSKIWGCCRGWCRHSRGSSSHERSGSQKPEEQGKLDHFDEVEWVKAMQLRLMEHCKV